MARIDTYLIPATSSSTGYTMYLLQTENDWERAGITALSQRGHDVSSRPVFVNGETLWCVCFRTTISEIEGMRTLVEEEAQLCKQTAQPALL